MPLVFNQHFTGNLDNWDPAVLDGLAKEREVIIFNNAGVASSSGEVPTIRSLRRKLQLLGNRDIDTIPTETMNALTRYSWPGNIRELQNLVERAVILSPGNVLHVPCMISSIAPRPQSPRRGKRLQRPNALTFSPCWKKRNGSSLARMERLNA